MKEIYLDNSATTIVCKNAADKILELLTLKYGNPSSLHEKGIEAENELKVARSIIAKSLDCDTREIYFTSGGTESNNLALFGAAFARKKFGNRIVTTEIEHSSVLESAYELERLGFEVVYLKPDKYGYVSKNDISDAINKDTILVSIMMVNNELGSILPVDCVKKIIKQNNSSALLHIDAVQAYGKMLVKPHKLGADLLTISAHKVHGPKGVGALFISKGVKILPRIFGGLQEERIRPGTQAAPLIAGFGEAVKEFGDINKRLVEIQELRDYCVSKLEQLERIHINSACEAIPYVINFSTCLFRSETILHYLGARNIYVSSGSACSKGKKSHVLESALKDKKLIDSAIRVSFSKYSTKEDVDIFINALSDGIKKLVRSN